MKFVHTSDWQLGMPFGQVHEKAGVLRKARMDAVKQVIALAQKERAQFIVAAGDLFDDNRVAPAVVEEASRILSNSPVKIYLLPGNHDALTQDSPYIRCPHLFTSSAVVLREEEPVPLDTGGTLYPCPARSKTYSKDPTEWMPSRADGDGIRIGVAHGSVGTPLPNDFPIAPKAAVLRGLDYLALGHWHGAKQMDERTWYCGAPEPTKFGERNAGKALVVEIAEVGALPVVREVHLAQYKWAEIERELHSELDLDVLLREIDATRGSNVLLWVRLSGNLPQALLDKVDAISNDGLFHLKTENSLQVTNGVHRFRHPLLREMSDLLVANTNCQDADKAETARRALSKLRMLAKHAGFEGEDA